MMATHTDKPIPPNKPTIPVTTTTTLRDMIVPAFVDEPRENDPASQATCCLSNNKMTLPVIYLPLVASTDSSALLSYAANVILRSRGASVLDRACNALLRENKLSSPVPQQATTATKRKRETWDSDSDEKWAEKEQEQQQEVPREVHRRRTKRSRRSLPSLPSEILATSEPTRNYLNVRYATYQEIAAPVDEECDHWVGRYALREVLGKGSFGIVYSALTYFMDRVAVKRVDCTGKSDKRIANIRQEAVLMSNHGHHPNIMPLFDALYSNQIYYTVMPQATMDLNALLNANPSIRADQPDFLQQAMGGTLSGLKHLHRHGVAHLDIKAENIFLFTTSLDENNKLKPGHRLQSQNFKIGDFGISKTSDQYGKFIPQYPSHRNNYEESMPPELKVEVTEVVGTSLWCAPEIVLKKGADCRIADMWSFGCLMHRLLGFPPVAFAEAHRFVKNKDMAGYLGRLDQLEQLMKAVQENIPVTLNNIVLLHNLACQCLRVNPNERITAAAALKHPWFHGVKLSE